MLAEHPKIIHHGEHGRHEEQRPSQHTGAGVIAGLAALQVVTREDDVDLGSRCEWVRSTGDVDVNKFAKQFAGGGHARAAGALIEGNLEVVRRKVVAAAREFLRAEDKEGVA